MNEARCKLCGRQQPSLTAAISCPLAQCEHKVAARRRALEEEREALARKRREEDAQRNADLAADLNEARYWGDSFPRTDCYSNDTPSYDGSSTDTPCESPSAGDFCSSDSGTDFGGGGGDSGGGGCSGDW